MAVTEHRTRHVPGAIEKLRPIVDLRSLAMQGIMSPEELSLCGQARALAQWHENARCCGHCGGTTLVKDGGWRRKCWSCGQEHFPRTDPVVIMLVTEGDCCLLTREPRFAATMYSALAGFLEPGEDIEHAVRREVMEEVGLEIDSVAYQESQPWPFPHSLMIGCIAECAGGDIRSDPAELEDARWFHREELGSGTMMPFPQSIAYRLIQEWLNP